MQIKSINDITFNIEEIKEERQIPLIAKDEEEAKELAKEFFELKGKVSIEIIAATKVAGTSNYSVTVRYLDKAREQIVIGVNTTLAGLENLSKEGYAEKVAKETLKYCDINKTGINVLKEKIKPDVNDNYLVPVECDTKQKAIMTIPFVSSSEVAKKSAKEIFKNLGKDGLQINDVYQNEEKTACILEIEYDRDDIVRETNSLNLTM